MLRRKLQELAKLQLPGLMPRVSFPDDGRLRSTPLRRRAVRRHFFAVQEGSAAEAAWSPEELALFVPVSASTGPLNDLLASTASAVCMEGLVRALNPDIKCASLLDFLRSRTYGVGEVRLPHTAARRPAFVVRGRLFKGDTFFACFH